MASPVPGLGFEKRPVIALALGTGSLHGIVHIGVLKACEAHGFRPDIITGTSAGAIVGALWAAGRRSAELRELASRIGWWEAASFPQSLRGLMSNLGVASFINRHVGGLELETLPIRFAAIATDLSTGKRRVLNSGDTGLAVAASSCVPVLFEPVVIEGNALVDGGLTEPVPIRAARELGATHVLAVDVQYRPYEGPVGKIISIGFQSMQIMVASLTAEQIVEADISIRLDVHSQMAQKPFESALIATGEAAFNEKWESVKRLQSGGLFSKW